MKDEGRTFLVKASSATEITPNEYLKWKIKYRGKHFVKYFSGVSACMLKTEGCTMCLKKSAHLRQENNQTL